VTDFVADLDAFKFGHVCACGIAQLSYDHGFHHVRLRVKCVPFVENINVIVDICMAV